jgi:hypothetical protein
VRDRAFSARCRAGRRGSRSQTDLSTKIGTKSRTALSAVDQWVSRGVQCSATSSAIQGYYEGGTSGFDMAFEVT